MTEKKKTGTCHLMYSRLTKFQYEREKLPADNIHAEESDIGPLWQMFL